MIRQKMRGIYKNMCDFCVSELNQLICRGGERAVELGLAQRGALPIYDGVADEVSYRAESPRIAWVLKEPWDKFDENGNPCGGGWSLVKEAFYKSDAWRNPVWQKIAYVMHGVRHGRKWEDMPRIRNCREMIHELRSMVWINVNKMPAQKNSSNGRFVRLYNEVWKDVLRKQIDFFDPNVIIFARTFECFRVREYSNAVFIKSYSNKWVKFYRYGGQVLIETYHPGRKGGVYVNALIEALERAKEELDIGIHNEREPKIS